MSRLLLLPTPGCFWCGVPLGHGGILLGPQSVGCLFHVPYRLRLALQIIVCRLTVCSLHRSVRRVQVLCTDLCTFRILIYIYYSDCVRSAALLVAFCRLIWHLSVRCI